jgi:hypothetical protein
MEEEESYGITRDDIASLGTVSSESTSEGKVAVIFEYLFHIFTF